MRFGSKKFRELREAKGLSQEDLAGKLGVSRVTISHWESEVNAPSLTKIGEIGQFFGIPAKFFIEENGEKAA